MTEMIPGPTAWAAERSIVPVFWRGGAAQILVLLAIATVFLRLSWWLPWALFAVAVVLFAWFLFGLLRVNKIALVEREAGYTTRNGTELGLELRHPRTGAVIRGAGEPRLSKQEFRDLVR